MWTNKTIDSVEGRGSYHFLYSPFSTLSLFSFVNFLCREPGGYVPYPLFFATSWCWGRLSAVRDCISWIICFVGLVISLRILGALRYVPPAKISLYTPYPCVPTPPLTGSMYRTGKIWELLFCFVCLSKPRSNNCKMTFIYRADFRFNKIPQKNYEFPLSTTNKIDI